MSNGVGLIGLAIGLLIGWEMIVFFQLLGSVPSRCKN